MLRNIVSYCNEHCGENICQDNDLNTLLVLLAECYFVICSSFYSHQPSPMEFHSFLAMLMYFCRYSIPRRWTQYLIWILNCTIFTMGLNIHVRCCLTSIWIYIINKTASRQSYLYTANSMPVKTVLWPWISDHVDDDDDKEHVPLISSHTDG